MIERDKSTENVGLVSKVEPSKPISCGHCGKPGHIITNCWKLDGKTPCEYCGKFNHKSEDCRIAKNKLQKEVKPTGLTSLKDQKGVKVKPLIDRNHFVEKNKGIKVNPLHNDKSCIEDEISPNTESDYMENYKPIYFRSRPAYPHTWHGVQLMLIWGRISSSWGKIFKFSG